MRGRLGGGVEFVGGPPAGPSEHGFQLVLKALAADDVFHDVDRLVIADLYGVERLNVRGEAVLHPAQFGLERAEEFVPEDEDPAVVLVEVLGVAPWWTR